jgi:signal transduction histidine kinase/CheY-like chemotaxis protein
MDVPYLRLIVMLHAAFGGVFLFLNRQDRSRFTLLLAWSWAIEAVRASINLPGVHDLGGVPSLWFSLSEYLCLFANFCLLAGCADLVGVRLPRWLAPAYFGVSIPLLVFGRLLLPTILAGGFGLAPDRAAFLGVFHNLVVMFVPVAVTRLVVLSWLAKSWRTSQLPGALVAALFCIPYAGFALSAPIQFYFTYNPEWIALLWCVRVLGFSIGLVMLMFSRQLAALQRSESGLAAAQASAKLGSWEYSVSTGTLLWSAELFRILNRDPAAGPPSFADVLPLVHPEDRASFQRHFVLALAISQGHRGEYRLACPDGSIRRLEVRNEATPGTAPDAGRLTGTMQDVTEQKQLEEKFLRAQRMENLGLLAAGIAHDFNNILTPVLMVAPMLRERMPAGADQKYLTTIEQSAERGAALVRQILSFVHGTGGRRVLVQSKHIMRDLAAMITETFPRSIKLEENIAGRAWPVVADPTQLHQVVLNLCVNARDAMPGGGTLRLRLANCTLDSAAAGAIPGGRAGDFVLIEVGDTGCGIAPEALPHIWEPFFTSKQPDKGTGLGLATVRGIVGTHEGFCSVETKVNAGTTFRVYLPAAETELPLEIEQSATPVPRGRGELVLVVDDEVNVREFTCATLANHGYRVLAARDGEEGLALCASRGGDISAVVADWHMPRLGGEGLVAALARLRPVPRILIISGLSSSGGGGGTPPTERGDAFLQKPFKPFALLAAIHRLLQAGPPGPS